MEWYFVIAVVGVGFAAGFINTVAGGGSVLALPMLMFLGLPANVANGTNRVAILLQSMVGVGLFQQKKIFSLKTDYKLALPAMAGSLAGALLAVEIHTALLEKIIGGVMVLMLLTVLVNPEAWIKGRVGAVAAKPTVTQYLIFFFIGFYGGFIQVGVGFFLLAGLVLGCGYDLVKANGIKLFIVLLYTVVALAIFFAGRQVDVVAGLTLAVGNMAGAWAGARFTIRGGAKYVRYVLILALLLMILKLFGTF